MGHGHAPHRLTGRDMCPHPLEGCGGAMELSRCSAIRDTATAGQGPTIESQVVDVTHKSQLVSLDGGDL